MIQAPGGSTQLGFRPYTRILDEAVRTDDHKRSRLVVKSVTYKFYKAKLGELVES
jgi:hypothetical protein